MLETFTETLQFTRCTDWNTDKSTALLVVDMQKYFTEPDHPFERRKSALETIQLPFGTVVSTDQPVPLVQKKI